MTDRGMSGGIGWICRLSRDEAEMIERHTIDFARVSFNVVSDADRGTITLQFDQAGGGLGSIPGILRAIHQRFGGGVLSRIRRWKSGEISPFVVSRHTDRILNTRTFSASRSASSRASGWKALSRCSLTSCGNSRDTSERMARRWIRIR